MQPRHRNQNGPMSRLQQLQPSASSRGWRISSSYLRAAAGHEEGFAGEWGEVYHAPAVLQEAIKEHTPTSSSTFESTCAECHARLSSRPRAAGNLLDWPCARTRNFTSSVSSTLHLQATACKTSPGGSGPPLRRCGVAHFAKSECYPGYRLWGCDVVIVDENPQPPTAVPSVS